MTEAAPQGVGKLSPEPHYLQAAINLCYSERNRWREGDKEWVHWNDVAAHLQGEQLAAQVKAERESNPKGVEGVGRTARALAELDALVCQQAADYLLQAGGGPMEDRLRLLGQQIEALQAEPKAVEGFDAATWLRNRTDYGATYGTEHTADLLEAYATDKTLTLRAELHWFRSIVAKHFGYDAPGGDGCNPLDECIAELRSRLQEAEKR